MRTATERVTSSPRQHRGSGRVARGGGARHGRADMDCASCAGKVTSALDGTEGVTSVDARPATGTVSVEYDDGRADGDDLTRAVESAGYEVTGTSGDGADGGRQGRGWNPERLDQSPGDQDLGRCGVAGYRRRRRTGAARPRRRPVVATVLSTEFSLADVLFLGAVATAGQEILRGDTTRPRTPRSISTS